MALVSMIKTKSPDQRGNQLNKGPRIVRWNCCGSMCLFSNFMQLVLYFPGGFIQMHPRYCPTPC